MDAIEFVRWCDEKHAQLVLATRRDFYERIDRDHIDRYERLDFHLVIHCTDGVGRHQVDFHDVELAPNRALYVQPGQVHRLSRGDGANYEAHYVAFPDAPSGPLPPAVGANVVQVDEATNHRLDLLYDLARSRSMDRPAESVSAEDAGLRDLLYLAFGFGDSDRSSPAGTTEHPEWANVAFTALRGDLESDLRAGVTVQHRATRLGFSTRTLDRACLAIAGATAKQVCDDRLALEARRLLSLPRASSTAVADRLGFSEPTNFTKFMKRTTGRTPSALLAA